MNARLLATQLIYKVFTEGHSLSQCLQEHKNLCQKPEDAALVQAICFGVIRWYPRLKFMSDCLIQKPIKQKEVDVLYLILVGLYQLSEMRIPQYAAIFETVEAVKYLNKPWATSLVNGVLRSYLRQAQDIAVKIAQKEETHYAHPQWWIDKIKHAWPAAWIEILTANNTQAPLSLRVNILKNTREAFLQRLHQENIAANTIPETKSGVTLALPSDITKLPGFTSGLFSVQDGAAQLAASLLQLEPNMRILDACAAPGGKTTHILEIEPHLSECVAVDISDTRTLKIRENLSRLDLSATVKTADLNDTDTWWNGEFFDRILLDAPCSASGVIRRHPDIKYLRKLGDIKQLTQKQMTLLNSLWPLLRRGGILLYVTCSIFPEENAQLMQNFLENCQDAKALAFTLPCGEKQSIGYQLLPGQNNMDGFYYALIGKDIK